MSSEASSTGRPSVISYLAATICGIVLGTVVGFGIGLGAGLAIVEVTSMSCFEGACGYYAVFIGLGGVIGAVVGAVAAIKLVRRRARKATT